MAAERRKGQDRRLARGKRELVERLKTQETLNEPWEQLFSIFDAIDEKVYVADPETYEILYANPAMKKLFGQDIVGKKCHSALQGLDEPCDFCTNHLIFGENLGKTHIWEFQNRKTENWLRCIDRAIRWSDGRMVRFEMAIDIHGRKVAEEALRTREERYRSMVENIHEVIYATDEVGRVSYISPVIESLTGYAPSEVIGHSFREFVSPDDLDFTKKRFAEVLSGEVKPTEFRLVKKSGEKMWVRTFSKPAYREGRAAGLQGVLSDITEYKEAEAKLRESEARYRELVESMNEGFTIVDEKGIRIYANNKMCEMLGYPIGDIVGRPVTDFLDERNKEIWKREFEKRKRGGSKPYSLTWIRKDGEEVNTIISPKPLSDENGKFTGSFSVITDISDLKRTEQALKEREKELTIKTVHLEEMNTALHVLLKKREEDRLEMEEKIFLNVKQLVKPYIEKLKKSMDGETQKTLFDILESNLGSITSAFSKDLYFRYQSLTPSEMQIAGLITEGKSTKEIAELMGVSGRTVESHRKNLRNKMGLKGKKLNLRTTLLIIK